MNSTKVQNSRCYGGAHSAQRVQLRYQEYTYTTHTKNVHR